MKEGEDEFAFFLCNEPGSFAKLTFDKRLPSILERVFEDWADFLEQHTAIKERLVALRENLVVKDRVMPLKHYHDYPIPAEGVTWSALPFLYVEILLYKHILEAWGWYDQGGPTHRVDPFKWQKSKAREACAGAVEGVRARAAAAPLHELLQGSFWGNKTDLSLHSLGEAQIVARGDASMLLVDDSAALASWISCNAPLARVDVVLDNYAFEVVNDLLLAQQLVQRGLASLVVLHAKQEPVFVSDATKADVEEAAAWIGVALEEEETKQQQRRGVCAVEHPFWSAHAEWRQTPPPSPLLSCSSSSLCIVKGDANYRKLVGERKYPPHRPFASCVSYFPSRAVCAMRGVKCELLCGVDAAACALLDQQAPGWKTDGSRGVIQFHIQP